MVTAPLRNPQQPQQPQGNRYIDIYIYVHTQRHTASVFLVREGGKKPTFPPVDLTTDRKKREEQGIDREKGTGQQRDGLLDKDKYLRDYRADSATAVAREWST